MIRAFSNILHITSRQFNHHLKLSSHTFRASTPILRFHFSTNPKQPQSPQAQPSKESPQKQAEPQPKHLQQLTEEQLFNIALGLDKDHQFKNDLIVAQDRYKKDIGQLKQAILFEDLLKKEIDILIYDTQGKPYFQHIIKIILMLVSVVGTVYTFYHGLRTEKKFKIYMEKTPEGRAIISVVKLLCLWVFVVALFKNKKFTNRYVQKIVYHTETQSFTFTKRKAYGRRYEQNISRFKILYTENPALIKRGTNYLNIQNQQQYKIGYVFAWKKEDLFSHLISQRIRT